MDECPGLSGCGSETRDFPWRDARNPVSIESSLGSPRFSASQLVSPSAASLAIVPEGRATGFTIVNCALAVDPGANFPRYFANNPNRGLGNLMHHAGTKTTSRPYCRDSVRSFLNTFSSL